jgi:uncharacterized membrane protein YeaQ/YmgE (transglycosylase-associated protein family)
MFEHIVQMVPMLVLAGLMSGWMAETLSRAGGYGFIPDMVLGLLGSVVAGAVWIVVANHGGMLGMFLVGCVGAALVIVSQRSLWHSARPGT